MNICTCWLEGSWICGSKAWVCASIFQSKVHRDTSSMAAYGHLIFHETACQYSTFTFELFLWNCPSFINKCQQKVLWAHRQAVIVEALKTYFDKEGFMDNGPGRSVLGISKLPSDLSCTSESWEIGIPTKHSKGFWKWKLNYSCAESWNSPPSGVSQSNARGTTSERKKEKKKELPSCLFMQTNLNF